MYCIKCGVQLADTETSCPLCQTRVYHPDFPTPLAEPMYPGTAPERKQIKRWSVMLVLTILYLLPVSICLVTDLSVNKHIDWSGYVIGGLLIFYTMVMLPSWFKRPNPVIFVPVTFGAIAVFLLYICYSTGGNWFFTFALPITAGVGLIVTAIVTLCRYILKGRLFIFGGAAIAFGVLSVVAELLLTLTFPMPPLFTWSLYPLSVLTLLGLAMISTAIFRPLRESLEKKFFL